MFKKFFLGLMLWSFTMGARCLIIGHRGAAGYEAENTLRSFQRALDIGVDMIEFDVYCCATGEVVVIHDENVKRTTNGIGYVEKLTLQQLKQLDAGKGERIPTLQEVLDLVDRRVVVNIELKGGGTAEPVARIIQYYVQERGWRYKDFVISSFNHYELKRCMQLLPEVLASCLLEGLPIDYAAFGQRAGAGAVGVSRKYVNSDFMIDASARGLKVFVYTVNEPDEIERIKHLGVSGIFSDFPDRLK